MKIIAVEEWRRKQLQGQEQQGDLQPLLQEFFPKSWVPSRIPLLLLLQAEEQQLQQVRLQIQEQEHSHLLLHRLPGPPILLRQAEIFPLKMLSHPLLFLECLLLLHRQCSLHPPMSNQAGFRQSPPAHSVAATDAQADTLDDASTLSGTDTGNAKAMRMLQQYFVSLAASGTVRSIVEEKELITNKLGIIYRKVKFIKK